MFNRNEKKEKERVLCTIGYTLLSSLLMFDQFWQEKQQEMKKDYGLKSWRKVERPSSHVQGIT